MNKLTRDLDQFLNQQGFRLVQLRTGGGQVASHVHIKVEGSDPNQNESGVNVQDCVDLNRQLRPWLEEHPKASNNFTLEVSSPGIQRPLTRLQDFKRFSGQRAHLKGYQSLLNDRKKLEVTILDVRTEPDRVIVEWKGKKKTLRLSEIASARLAVDFDEWGY